MSCPLCNSLKSDGSPCGSPALRGKKFCYFHLDPELRRLKATWRRVNLTMRVTKERARDLRRYAREAPPLNLAPRS